MATTTPGWAAKLTGAQRNAYAALVNLFNSYGLGSLAPKILQYVQEGYGEDAVTLQLQESDEYKKRFAGNEARRKAGLRVLTPAEYLQTEAAYKATLKAYSMPASFYDHPDDFSQLMANDISPEELKSRAQHAWDFSQSLGSKNAQMLRDYYGVDASHVAAYFLDPKKGQALIERQAAAAGYGAIAARQNIGVGKSTAESWVDKGISADQVASGVEQAAAITGDLSRIGRRYGETYTTGDALGETVTGLASARRKRERLTRREVATFGGNTGSATFGARDTGAF